MFFGKVNNKVNNYNVDYVALVRYPFIRERERKGESMGGDLEETEETVPKI